MARVAVKVHPRARRSALAGRFGEAYKLDLAAHPVDGRANDECISFCARLAGVPRGRVRIVTDLTSRTKLIEIDGITQEELDKRLSDQP